LVEESLANGHKVLLFSSFVKVLDHFRELLDEKDIRSYYINGDTSASLRVNLAEKFNTKEDVKVMLVSLKAGGTGLNLQGADIVVHLDPWWNNAAEEQATDRAYRIGQTRPVTVYKLISHGSVEKRVVELQEMKKDLLESVVKTGEENITRLSMDDMKFILS
jgi:SNF2 family DNA or RNA helicase